MLPRLLGHLAGVPLGVGDVQVGGLLRLRQDPDGLEVRVVRLGVVGPALPGRRAQAVHLLGERRALVQELDQLVLDPLEELADLVLVEPAAAERRPCEGRRLDLARGQPGPPEARGWCAGFTRSPLCEGFQPDAVAGHAVPEQPVRRALDHGVRPAHVDVVAVP